MSTKRPEREYGRTDRALAFTADGLSSLRAILGPIIFIWSMFCVFGDASWSWPACLCILAWVTDLFDGPAARKWGSHGRLWRQDAEDGLIPKRSFKATFDADGIADSSLAFFSSAVPVIYYLVTTQHKLAILAAGYFALFYIASALLGWAMVSAMQKDPDFKKNETKALVLFNMTVFHGVFQIGFTITWFVIMAFGGVMFIPTVIMLGVVAYKQLPKLKLWLNGRLTPTA